MSGVSINRALVVGHEHNGAWVAGERCENLITTCRVEVICWLIEQEDVRAADNKGCEREPSSLTTRQGAGKLVNAITGKQE